MGWFKAFMIIAVLIAAGSGALWLFKTFQLLDILVVLFISLTVFTLSAWTYFGWRETNG